MPIRNGLMLCLHELHFESSIFANNAFTIND